MNLNNTILILLGAITGIQTISKISLISFFLLISLIIVGYGITKDYIFSLSIGFIITYIILYLNTNEKKKYNLEEFKNKKKIDKKKTAKNKKKKKNVKNKYK